METVALQLLTMPGTSIFMEKMKYSEQPLCAEGIGGLLNSKINFAHCH